MAEVSWHAGLLAALVLVPGGLLLWQLGSATVLVLAGIVVGCAAAALLGLWSYRAAQRRDGWW